MCEFSNYVIDRKLFPATKNLFLFDLVTGHNVTLWTGYRWVTAQNLKDRSEDITVGVIRTPIFS